MMHTLTYRILHVCMMGFGNGQAKTQNVVCLQEYEAGLLQELVSSRLFQISSSLTWFGELTFADKCPSSSCLWCGQALHEIMCIFLDHEQRTSAKQTANENKTTDSFLLCGRVCMTHFSQMPILLMAGQVTGAHFSSS